ncbi:MAG: hypothetical protein A2289_05050 [Deltaproteobacteria bacterium RIFOXYA12_FULL_58_15]|nr:MAG: hypothetical protein A2289_05050 [Deltaproteobacteria bacterium RIFOXYA12_FULL_58_15]OGR09388.1 MAG: hypothetical protein A2341_18030 [Deltaproteobacteria bacterium RIFOXYB12_FULL_58_9]
MRSRLLLSLAVSLTSNVFFSAIVLAEDGDGLSNQQEAAIAQEAISELDLQAIVTDDPANVDRLWALIKRLAQKRAYCRATEHLETIKELSGLVTDNRAFAAQAIFMCAQSRFRQGEMQESAAMLQRAIAIVPDRPEYRDLQFKLALVRSKEAIKQEDLATVEQGLTEAMDLGKALGPGGGDRLAEWAIPLIHEAANDVAGWSQRLLDAKDLEKADAVSQVALRFHPHNRIANGVGRDLLMMRILPIVLAGIGLFVAAAIAWAWVRKQRVKKAALSETEIST